jgi:hypothetical protein
VCLAKKNNKKRDFVANVFQLTQKQHLTVKSNHHNSLVRGHVHMTVPPVKAEKKNSNIQALITIHTIRSVGALK